MNDVTLYLCDEQWVFMQAITQDKFLPVPRRSITQPPPETTGDEVAVWTGREWRVLPERPPAPPAPAPAVPESVSRFQARMALRQAGLFDAVEAMMAHPDTPIIAVEAWQTAQEFRRISPTIAAMAQALSLTDEQLDDLFMAAGGIEA